MISIAEALEQVRRAATPRCPIRMRMLETLGLVLADDVVSDTDSPPHDKALVDGYALRAADVSSTGETLKVLEQVLAGSLPTREVTPGTATQIMTGAPLPAGADAVVMVERTERLGPAEATGSTEEFVRVLHTPIQSGDNILRQGVSMRRGEVILRSGGKIRPIEMGLLAEMGATEVLVHPRPNVAILSTGDEIVSHEVVPAPGQIRNSNGPMLTALTLRGGGIPANLGIVPDREELLTHAIESGLEHDVLLLSGGVSAGVMDLTPKILKQLQVTQIFHQIDLKPGKPLWFGVREHEAGRCLVFGLPGNPVSSLVCFELFVRPALEWISGNSGYQLESTEANLTQAHQQRGNRATYFPAFYERSRPGSTIQTLAWKGSADLRTLASANALAYFPPGDRLYAEGESVQVQLLSE